MINVRKNEDGTVDVYETIRNEYSRDGFNYVNKDTPYNTDMAKALVIAYYPFLEIDTAWGYDLDYSNIGFFGIQDGEVNIEKAKKNLRSIIKLIQTNFDLPIHLKFGDKKQYSAF